MKQKSISTQLSVIGIKNLFYFQHLYHQTYWGIIVAIIAIFSKTLGPHKAELW